MDDTVANDAALRETLRRQTYDLKVGLADLSEKLFLIDKDAAWAARKARLLAFEAWTILATPFEEEENH